MKKIRVNFCDQWEGFDPCQSYIYKILEKRYKIEISEDPDFVFCGSNFIYEFLKYPKSVKIFITGENIVPNFNIYDYAAASAYMEFENRYFRKPVYFASKEILDRSNITPDLTKRKFCNFIYHNSKFPESKKRIDFCLELQKYKTVDCPGKILHNIDCPELEPRNGDWYISKQEFLRNYKFTIAFENSFSNGYTTEKLIQPFYSYSIPIYWGNPRVIEDFNPKAFINCNDYNNDFDLVIEKIKELDNNDNLYLEMLSQRPVQENYDFDLHEKFKDWIFSIIENGRKQFDKGYMYNYFEKAILGIKNLEEKEKKETKEAEQNSENGDNTESK